MKKTCLVNLTKVKVDYKCTRHKEFIKFFKHGYFRV